MVTKEFSEFAKSYAGCNGKSFTSKVWVSGIEWGNREKKEKSTVQSEIDKPVKELQLWSDKSSPFDRRLLKFLDSIQNQNFDYANRFAPDDILKLNLFPFSFNNTVNGWNSEHNLISGLKNRYEYNTWCHLNRSPFLNDLVVRYKPEIVICFGISYIKEFFTAYIPRLDGRHQIDVNSFTLGKREYFIGKNTNPDLRTKVLVFPFLLGPSGLNSDALLGEAVKIVTQVLKDEELSNVA